VGTVRLIDRAMDDLDALGPYEVRFIQPYQATKRYICPSCNQPTRTGSHRTAEGATRFCRKCEAELGK